jgi:hypothetical protein
VKVFSWKNEVAPSTPCRVMWTLNLSPRTWWQTAMISRWAGRLSRTGWLVEAIRRLCQTSSNHTVALVARQQLCWGQVLVHFPCICRGGVVHACVHQKVMPTNLIIWWFALLKVKLWLITLPYKKPKLVLVFGGKMICTKEAFKFSVLPLPRA